jgi:hypothetical protein
MRRITQGSAAALCLIILAAPQAARAQCGALNNVSVTITNGPAPNPVPADGATASVTNLSASATAPTPPAYCTLNSPTYTWSTGAITYSTDNTNWVPSPGGIAPTLNGNGATATLSCTFTRCGYWRVPVSCLIHYDDYDFFGFCNDCWEGTGTVTVNMTSWTVTVAVTVFGGNAAGQGLRGQLVQGTATICPNGLAATYQWTITGNIFKTYSADNSSATVNNVPATDLQLQTLSWCWLDAGAKTVSCQATIAGRSMSDSKNVTILDPVSLVNYTSTIGASQFRAGRTADPTRVGVYGADPANPQVEPGIQFNNTFGSLAGLGAGGFAEGQWQFTQMVQPARSITAAGGITQLNKNGSWMLDTTYPYEGTWATNTTNSTVDSPSNGLVAVGAAGTTFTAFTANNEQFKMYVLMQPPGAGAQYVPMKYVAWNWSATATWNAPNWVLTNNAAQTNAAVATTDHPRWKDNVNGAQYQNLTVQPFMKFKQAPARAARSAAAEKPGRPLGRLGAPRTSPERGRVGAALAPRRGAEGRRIPDALRRFAGADFWALATRAVAEVGH